mgnify:FL=1
MAAANLLPPYGAGCPPAAALGPFYPPAPVPSYPPALPPCMGASNGLTGKVLKSQLFIFMTYCQFIVERMR